MVRYSFLVGLFHPRLHAGLSRRTLPVGHGSVTVLSRARQQAVRYPKKLSAVMLYSLKFSSSRYSTGVFIV